MLSLKKSIDAETMRRLFFLSAAALVLAVSLARYAFVYYALLLFSLVLTPLSYMAAGVTLFERDVTRQREFRLLLAFLLWTLVCAVLNERRGESLLNNQADISSLVMTVFLCFPLSTLLRPALFQKFLRYAASATVLIVSAFDALGIFAALTDRYIMFPFNSQYGIGISPIFQRLDVLCNPNSVGMIAIVSVVLTLYLIRLTKCRAWKIVYVLCILCMYLATALANARTSCYAIAICFGLLSLQTIVNCQRIKKMLWRAVIGSTVFFGVTAALFFGCRLLIRGFNALHINLAAQAATAESNEPALKTVVTEPAPQAAQAEPVPLAAQAEPTPQPAQTEAPPTPTPRMALDRPPVDFSRFGGRTPVWQGALTELRNDPSILLFGVSPGLVSSVMEKYPKAVARNLHNVLLQMLFSTGCIGLLLFLTLLVSLFVRCWRLFFTADPDRRAESILPLLLAGVLVLSTMESFLLLYPDAYFANVWFFLIAGYICLMDKPNKKPALRVPVS